MDRCIGRSLGKPEDLAGSEDKPKGSMFLCGFQGFCVVGLALEFDSLSRQLENKCNSGKGPGLWEKERER